MTAERGQAAIEFVFAAGLAASVAIGTLPLFEVWQARARAERIAGQAAVLVAEGRPLPAAVTHGADVGVHADTVRAIVRVDLLGHETEVAATARIR